MGTSLNGLTPQNTYPALIKVGDNTSLTSSLKTLSDGIGNDLTIQASTTGVNFTGTVGGIVSGVAGAIQFSAGSAFASDAANFFWDDTNNRLGIGTNAPASELDLRGSLSIQRDATNFTMRLGNLGQINAYIDASTNNQFYLVDATFSNTFILNNLGTGFGVSPIASTRVAIKGSGSTAATNSFLVQNGGGANLLRVRDDGNVFCEGGGSLTSVGIVGTVYGLFGGAGFEPSASLVCGGTTTGFLPPRMTTTQKNAIATPAAGLVVYDSTTNKLCCYNGTTWNDLF